MHAENTLRKLLVTCDYPPVTGGQAAYFSCLWSEVDSDNFMLLAPGSGRAHQNASRMQFMHLPRSEKWLSRIARTILLIFYVLRAHAQFKPGQIQFGQLIAGGLCGVVIKALRSTPYVCFCHGADVREFTRHVPGRILTKHILRSAQCIVANSNATADYVRTLTNNRVVVLNPGVSHRFFVRDAATVDKLKSRYSLHNKTVMITVGRLVERKGHDIAIQALPCIAQAIPDIHYIIAGDGPCRAHLQDLADGCGVSSRVTFCGQVQDSELPSYYRLASVFIMVSRHILRTGDIEGFGIVYLEANAAGLPVVAGKSGGIEDAVRDGETGIIVKNPGDISLVAMAVQTILSDKKTHKYLSAHALAWAQKHTCDSMRIEWLEKVG